MVSSLAGPTLCFDPVGSGGTGRHIQDRKVSGFFAGNSGMIESLGESFSLSSLQSYLKNRELNKEEFRYLSPHLFFLMSSTYWDGTEFAGRLFML